ncbi:hypothetical protein FOL47_010796 [Perkinsus chesapeaki]|uniref:Berberine/berberine-like domain-containing protein n=1 Tax=Perkinsus chesapeaki TaxID=330153 RepID=A0A7J6L0E4_PERCH|nr:hypothetical protein FOL47_010796 [Perkinsus chesapeaki]
MRVLIASSLIVSAYSVTSTSTVTNTNIYSPEDIEFWHQFCHDAVDDSSYCKYNHVPSLCQFSLIACGPSLLTTAGSLPPTDPTTASMVRAFEEAVTSQPGDGLWAKFKVKGGFDMNFEGMCMCEPISNECGDCNVAMDSVDSALDKDNWVTSPSELVTDHGYATWSWAGCTEWADPRTPASAEYPGVSGDFSGAAKGCYDYDASLSVNSPWKSISVYIKHSDATESFWNTVWDIVHEPECEDRNVCILTFEYYGGKMLQEPQDCSGAGPCTSFIHRSHGWNIQISSLWSKGDSGGENVAISWVAKAFATLDAKSSLHTSYQNYLSNQWTVSPWKVRYFPGQDVQPDHWKYRFFGDSIYSRLQQVKCDYNPDNLFVTADTADIVVQLPDDCST